MPRALNERLCVASLERKLSKLQELFTPKDRLDYRYFYKRGSYLGIVKAALQKAEVLKGADVQWESQDERRPVVAITVGKGGFFLLADAL